MREVWARAAWGMTAHRHRRGAPGRAGQLSHTRGDRRAVAPAHRAGTQHAGAAQGGPGCGEAVARITTAESLPHRADRRVLAPRFIKGRALQDATLASGVWGRSPAEGRREAPDRPGLVQGSRPSQSPPCSVTHTRSERELWAGAEDHWLSALHVNTRGPRGRRPRH